MNSEQNHLLKDLNDNIYSVFELEKLPEDKQEEAMNRIGKIIFQNVMLRVLPLMSEEDQAEYTKMLENDATPEDLLEFFHKKIPDFLMILSEETRAFRESAGKAMEEARKAL